MDSSREYRIGYRNKLSLGQNHPLEAPHKCPHILQTGGGGVLSRVTFITFHGSLQTINQHTSGKLVKMLYADSSTVDDLAKFGHMILSS